MAEIFYGTAKNGEPVWDNKRLLNKYLLSIEGKKFWAEIARETGIRSDNQNRALHKYFELLANELNAAGYSIQKLLEHTVEVSWSKDTVKELIWRPVQEALIQKKSTTKLDKIQDIDLVYDHLNRHLSEEFGLHVPFPNNPMN